MWDVFEQIGKDKKTPDEVRREISIAINRAWESNNSKMRELFKNKPSPEEFILKIAAEVKTES